MLQSLRTAASSWIAKGLFAILLASFGLWGIGDIFRSGTTQNTTVAEVGDVKIDMPTLRRAFDQDVQRMRNLFGGELTAQQAQAFGILDQSLNRLIDSTLVRLAARDLGLVVDDQLVARQIANEPAFKNAEGKFDPQLFNSVLRNNNLTEQGVSNIIREQVQFGQVMGIIDRGATAPSEMAKDLYRVQQEKRVADVLRVPYDSIKTVPAPSQEELLEFHQDNAVRYTAPEYRTLTVVRLNAQDIAKDIGISEDDVRASYEARRTEFQSPETRDIRQVLMSDQGQAQKVADNIKAGQSIEEAAKAEGVTADLVENIARDQIVPELADTVFTLPLNETSPPLQSPLGWHVVQVVKTTPASEKSFEQVRPDILSALQAERAGDAFYEFSEDIEDALAGGATLEEVARTMKLPLTIMGPVDAKGTRPDDATVENVPNTPAILNTAFELEKGKTSNLVQGAEGDAFLVQVKDITPATLKPLEMVKDQVLADWQAEQRKQLATSKADGIAEKLRSGSDMQALAKQEKLEFTSTPPLGRAAQEPELAGLVDQLFSLQASGVTTVKDSKGVIVVRLKDIQVPDPSQNAEAVTNLRTNLSNQIASDLGAQFLQALRSEYPVTINAANLQNTVSNQQ